MKPALFALATIAAAVTMPAIAQADVPNSAVTGPRTYNGPTGNSTYTPCLAETECYSFEYGRFLRANDYAGAIGFLQGKAGNGNVWAMLELGALYSEGRGTIAANAETALGWYFEAAVLGDAQASLIVGAAFSRGIGVEQNTDLGRQWIARAADIGDYRIKRDARRLLASL